MPMEKEPERLEILDCDCSEESMGQYYVICPFATESGKYELCLDEGIKCDTCRQNFLSKDELTEEQLEAIDESFNEKYEGVTSRFEVDR